MLTLRNVSAAAFFLFGTTFLWLTASFTGRTPAPTGVLWSAVNVAAIAVIAGFSVAAWGIFKATPWWEPVAAVTALIGLVSIAPYVVAIDDIGGLADQGVEMNIAIHLLGSLAVLTVALVPVVHDWFVHRLA